MSHQAAAESVIVGTFANGGCLFRIERFRFLGPRAGHEPVRIALFAGVHGDEPAGPAAVETFLHALEKDPMRAAGYDLWLYPAVNPAGLKSGTRANGSGKDLNREFWRGSLEPEVRIIESELETGRFDGVITLHADDTCEGHYG